MFNVQGDRTFLEEVLCSLDSDSWKESINDEMDFLTSNKTWKLVDLFPYCIIISYKYVFKTKLKPYETIDKYKAKLVAKGFT